MISLNLINILVKYIRENKGGLLTLLFIALMLIPSLIFAGSATATDPTGGNIGTINASNNTSDNHTYFFRIENPSIGHLYFIIFNGISSLFNVNSGTSGSTNYISLLRLAFTVGGFIVFAMAVGRTIKDGSHAGIFDFFKYLIIGSSIMILVFSSKSTLLVVSDKLPGTYCSSYNPIVTDGTLVNNGTTDDDYYSAFSVGNFPTLLAWTFTTTNKVGYELTKMAKTLFSDVSDLSNAVNSSEYASYLDGVNALLTTSMDEMLRDDNITTVFPTDSNTSDFNNISRNQALGAYFRIFMKDCIFMVNSTDSNVGTKIQEAIESTSYFTKTMDGIFDGTTNAIITYKGDTPRTLGSTTLKSGGTVASQIFNLDGSSGTCGEFWREVLKPAIDTVSSDTILCTPALAGKVDPAVMYMLTGEANAAPGKASEIAINSGLFQMYGDMKNGGYVAEDISYATGKSKADFVMNNVGTGMYMAQMLPYLQMGIRAVLYAFFPFVFVVILLPGGIQVLISFLSTLLWVELWSPVAAVLNLFLGSIAANKFQNAFEKNGFNPGSALNILSDSAMLASVGGYLYASVPALTWLVLKGSGQMLGSITGAMAGGYASNLASANINQDMAKLAKQKTVNDFNSTETGKFLSMAEIEQNEALAKGYAEGATMGLMLQEGGGTWAGYQGLNKDAGRKKGLENVASAVEGRNLNLADANARGMKNVENTKSNTFEMKMKGVFNPDGTINKQQLQEVANTYGTKAVTDYLTSKKVQDKFGGQSKRAAEFISKGKAIRDKASIEAAHKIGSKTLMQNEVDGAMETRGRYDQLAALGYSASRAGKVGAMIESMDKNTFQNTMKILGGYKKFQNVKNAADIEKNVSLAKKMAMIMSKNPNMTMDQAAMIAGVTSGADSGAQTKSDFYTTQELAKQNNTTYDETKMEYYNAKTGEDYYKTDAKIRTLGGIESVKKMAAAIASGDATKQQETIDLARKAIPEFKGLSDEEVMKEIGKLGAYTNVTDAGTKKETIKKLNENNKKPNSSPTVNAARKVINASSSDAAVKTEVSNSSLNTQDKRKMATHHKAMENIAHQKGVEKKMQTLNSALNDKHGRVQEDLNQMAQTFIKTNMYMKLRRINDDKSLSKEQRREKLKKAKEELSSQFFVNSSGSVQFNSPELAQEFLSSFDTNNNTLTVRSKDGYDVKISYGTNDDGTTNSVDRVLVTGIQGQNIKQMTADLASVAGGIVSEGAEQFVDKDTAESIGDSVSTIVAYVKDIFVTKKVSDMADKAASKASKDRYVPLKIMSNL